MGVAASGSSEGTDRVHPDEVLRTGRGDVVLLLVFAMPSVL